MTLIIEAKLKDDPHVQRVVFLHERDIYKAMMEFNKTWWQFLHCEEITIKRVQGVSEETALT